MGEKVVAVIMVGGPTKGTRFRPLSFNTPKPLFPLAGQAMVYHPISACKKIPNLAQIYLVGFYEEKEFALYVSSISNELRVPVRYLREDKPHGSAGGLYYYRDIIMEDSPSHIFLLNCDVCCSFPLADMLEAHKGYKGMGTMLVIKVSAESANQFGELVADPATKELLHYTEKPETFVSDLINCGVYVFTPDIFSAIQEVSSHREGRANLRRVSSFEALPSPNLYVANCGPAVGLSYDTIAAVFAAFGEIEGVYAADESGARVVVSFAEEGCAQNALNALGGRPCPELGGRSLHIRYSVIQPTSQGRANDSVPVSLLASDLNIPGLYLFHDFVTAKEEEELLAAVDERHWNNLSKRRVQHYGYEFCYDTRNVDSRKNLGELPRFVSPILERISMLPNCKDDEAIVLDQLTVNEYPSGVGLSPHIDTHSAFEGLIFSLSLAGPCIMEFRRYLEGGLPPRPSSSSDFEVECSEKNSNFLRRAIYLPPRSMLLLSGEARYAWNHYIPHHKIDMVNDSVIRRGSRRVSFTLRKIRTSPCQCEFPEYCDSQRLNG